MLQLAARVSCRGQPLGSNVGPQDADLPRSRILRTVVCQGEVIHMSKSAATLLLVSMALASAHAQPSSTFQGTWAVTWEGDKQTYEARLVLGAQGGTWKTSARSKNNPCVGREVPVKIEAATVEEARLTLAFSEAIPGCKDSKVTLRAAAGSVTGTRGDNQLTLRRE